MFGPPGLSHFEAKNVILQNQEVPLYILMTVYTGFTKLIEHITNVHNTMGFHFPGIYLVLIDPLGPEVFNDI